MKKKKIKKTKLKLITDLNKAIAKLEYKRDWFMYERPNDEIVNQIDRSLIQLRRFREMVYYEL